MLELTLNTDVPNADFLEAQRHESIYEAEIESYKASIKRHKEQIEAFLPLMNASSAVDAVKVRETVAAELEQALLNIFPGTPDNFYTEGAGTSWINNLIGSIGSHFNSYNGALQSHQQEMDSTVRHLRAIKEKLENIDPTPLPYSRDDIDAQLLDVEGVVDGSVYLLHSKDREGEVTTAYLNWEIEPGFMDINFLNYDMPWVHLPEGEKLRIPRAGCRVEIDLINKKIKMIPTDSEHMCFYMWEGTANVHPHLLRNHIPCLGDFEGPVHEAMSISDWNTVATLLVIYFNNVDARDSAGKHWVEYFIQTFGETRMLDRDGLPPRRRGYKHYFPKEDGTFEMKLSKYPTTFEEIEVTTLEELDAIATRIREERVANQRTTG